MKASIPIRDFIVKRGSSWCITIPAAYIKNGLLDPKREVLVKIKNVKRTENDIKASDPTSRDAGNAEPAILITNSNGVRALGSSQGWAYENVKPRKIRGKKKQPFIKQ